MLRHELLSDEELAPIWAAQCRAARALLGWRQEDLAQAAGLSVGLVRKYEMPEGRHTVGSTAALRQAFEAAGITFSVDPEIYSVALKRTP
jgi:transcriptional regulator with XRE-family HTH domain